MWKKISLIFLSTFILFSSTLFMSQKASANPVVAIAAGSVAKQMIKGIAEKAGLALTAKQVDNVVGVMNKRAANGDTKITDWVANVSSKTPMVSEKSGFQKFVLDPILWVSGLDTIFDIIGLFNDSAETGTPVTMYSQCVQTTYDNVNIPAGYSYVVATYNGNMGLNVFETSKASLSRGAVGAKGWTITPNDSSGFYKYTYSKTTSATSWSLSSQGTQTTELKNDVATVNKIYISSAVVDCNYTPTSADVVDLTTYDNDVINNYDNDTYIDNFQYINYPMELDLPTDPTTSFDGLWNVADSTITGGTFYVIDSGGGDVIINPPDGSGGEVEPLPDNTGYIASMYNTLKNYMTTATDGFKSLTTGMTGFTTFLGTFYSWLPTEFVTLLGAGFALGVVSFFLRR